MDQSLQQALEFQKKGDLKGAIDVLQQSSESGTCSAQGYYFLACLLDATGDTDAALGAIDKALTGAPENTEIWYSKGNIVSKSGDVRAAIYCYERAVEFEPTHLQALVNLGINRQLVEDYPGALEAAIVALRNHPTEIKAWLLYIGSLGHMRDFAKALKACAEAHQVFPKNAEVTHINGNVLLASGESDAAFQMYQAALQLDPNSVSILSSMGDFYAQYKDPRDALPYLQKALKLDPHSLSAKHRTGVAYLNAGFPSDAAKMLLEVVQKSPTKVDAFDGLLLSSHYLEQVDETELYQLHTKWAETHEKEFQVDPVANLERLKELHDRPLTVAFISPDFRNHSVARFMTPLIRNAASSGCEVICYSDVKRQDDFTERLAAMGCKWVYSYELTDEALAARIHDDEVVVLVDLAGHTGLNRLKVFARQPAPIQVSWLGYPNTTGLKRIQYRLSDAIADPVGQSDQLSSEKIIRMPDGFHCFEPPVNLPAIVDTPALKHDGVLTFGSFNNQSKFNAVTLRRWCSVLKALPKSRLILKNRQLSDQRNREFWTRVFVSMGIEPDRIEFLGYAADLEAHYRTYERIDIALDSFPYNGTTTTCEALWMGVPVLTIMGNSQRSRTAASLLTHVGMPDWIAMNESGFIESAVYWSEHLAELNEIRIGLREKAQDSPIGDAEAFAGKFFQTIRELVKSHGE